MSFTDPGHTHNLNAEQERMLRQFWAATLSDMSSDPLDKQLNSLAGFDMSALSAALPSASKAASQASLASNSSANSKKGWFGGWGGKKQEVAAEESETSDEDFDDAPSAAEGAGDAATAEALAAEGAVSSKVNIDRSASGANASKEALLDMCYYAMASDHPDQFPLRFLRARKWDLNKSFEMFVKALQWRVGTDIKGLLERGEENVGLTPFERGKSYFLPKPDSQGRPVIVIHVERHDRANDPLEETERFTIWQNENCRLLLKGEVETGTLLFDMSNFGLKNMDWNFVKLLISILEAYYPESLGFALIVNAPWIFNSIWKVIKGLLDPVVIAKFHFVKSSELSKYIPADAVPKPLGGPYEFKYTPAGEKEKAYKRALAADTAGRAKAEAAWKAAWSAFQVATREWIIAGNAFDNAPNSKTAAANYKAASTKRLALHENVKATFKIANRWWYSSGVTKRHGLVA